MSWLHVFLISDSDGDDGSHTVGVHTLSCHVSDVIHADR